MSILNNFSNFSYVHDKKIQCNENDLIHSTDISSKISPTTLMIRLSHRFIKLFLDRKHRLKRPILKVEISTEILQKLFKSIRMNSKSRIKSQCQLKQFKIQSQFG